MVGTRTLRPFARRRDRTSRPFAVAMRARKPWVRLRFILLGWYVLFIVFPSPGPPVPGPSGPADMPVVQGGRPPAKRRVL